MAAHTVTNFTQVPYYSVHFLFFDVIADKAHYAQRADCCIRVFYDFLTALLEYLDLFAKKMQRS